jgi:hypothetical protein
MASGMMICGAGNINPCTMQQEEFDDVSRLTLSTAHSEGSGTAMSSVAESQVLNTDYRRVTPLFQAIEKENWEGVHRFLTSGKWNDSLFTSSNSHLQSPSKEIQVKTWVTSYNRRGKVAEWSQLPLHAAISHKAPFVVINMLVQLYPKGIQCTDQEGMLPIHLAFGFGASDQVLALLLEPFPSAMSVKGLGGRLPYECCDLGPNKVRGHVYKIATAQAKETALTEIDQEWRDFTMAAKKTVGLEEPLEIGNKKLTEFILDLLKDRKELEHRKKREAVISAAAKKNKSPRSPSNGASSPRSPGRSQWNLARSSSRTKRGKSGVQKQYDL